MLLRFLSLLFAIVSSVFALQDYHEVYNREAFQTCSSIANYHGVASDKRVPGVSLEVLNHPSQKFKLSALFIRESDLGKTGIKSPDDLVICTDKLIKANKCQPSEKDHIIVRGVELAEESYFNTVITPKATKQEFRIEKSGSYCVLALFQTSSKEDGQVLLNWTQSYGELIPSDYTYLHILLVLSLLYIATACGYYYYVFKRANDQLNKNADGGIERKNRIIQRKILTYMVLASLSHIFRAFHLVLVNKFGYVHDKFFVAFVDFFSLAFDTVFAVWTCYNLLMISFGHVLIGGFKPSTLSIICVRLLTGVTFITFLIFALEESTLYTVLDDLSGRVATVLVYIEVCIFSLVVVVSSFFTYKKLVKQSKSATAKRFIVTMTLVSTPAVFLLFVNHFAYKFSHLALEAVSKVTSYSYVYNYVILVLVALLWKSSLLESEVVNVD